MVKELAKMDESRNSEGLFHLDSLACPKLWFPQSQENTKIEGEAKGRSLGNKEIDLEDVIRQMVCITDTLPAA